MRSKSLLILAVVLFLVFGKSAIYACPKEWSLPDRNSQGIQVSISAPSNSAIIKAGQEITCTSTDSDEDTYIQSGQTKYSSDEIDKRTWRAEGGTFTNGTAGDSVKWKSDTPGQYKIYFKADDKPTPVVLPDTGNRDDSEVEVYVTVTVIKVCIKQGATDITDQTRDTVVGRNVSLAADVLPSGTTVTAYQWSVPEKAIENYTANASAGTVNLLESSEKQSQSVSYYAGTAVM